jgi:hypothetical protein
MRDLGHFEGERLSRSHGYLEPAQQGESLLGVLSGLAVLAFLMAGNMWLIGLFS